MSHSSSSSSSLIHLHRPAHTFPLPADSELHVDARPASPSLATSPSSSFRTMYSAQPSYAVHHPTPPAPPVVNSETALRRVCSAGSASTGSNSLERVESTLSAGHRTASGIAKPKSEWQPDEDSPFCTFPSCSTFFAPTALSLGPRRHHCRLCGFTYCHAHTASRRRLANPDLHLRVETVRVCDTCASGAQALPIGSAPTSPHRRPSTTPSDESLEHDELLITPASESGGSSLFTPRPSADDHAATAADADDAPESRYAPIEDWMDRSGILSLYPLAQHASHSRPATSAKPKPAARPLFEPSMSARRAAKEKEMERLTVRERRMGCDKAFRMQFSGLGPWNADGNTPEPSDDEELVLHKHASALRDRSRPRSRVRTPLEKALDFSTF
ncbi:hypothetical protein Q5752_006436 [Cryptotrichosporon argae]